MTEQLLTTIEDDGDAGEPIAIDTHDNVVELTDVRGRVLRLDRTELRAAINDDHRQAA